MPPCPRVASVGLALRGKLYKLDEVESSLDAPSPPMRSLLERTAMGQGETPHPIHAVPAGKPICCRVPRVALVGIALRGSPPISIMRNILARSAAPQMRSLLDRTAMAQGEKLHPIHVDHPVNRCAVVSRALHRSSSRCMEASCNLAYVESSPRLPYRPVNRCAAVSRALHRSVLLCTGSVSALSDGRKASFDVFDDVGWIF